MNDEEILRLEGPSEDLRRLWRVAYHYTGLITEEWYVYTPDQCVEGDQRGWTSYFTSKSDWNRQYTEAEAREYLQENLK